jgi:Carboxypeptidase regulatory-like domain
MKNTSTPFRAAVILLILLSIAPIMFARSNTIAPQASNYVTGKVTSASSGRPVRSVWVIVKQGDNEKGRSLTGDDGSYYISNLGDGQYEIIATKGASQHSDMVTLPQNKVFHINVNF